MAGDLWYLGRHRLYCGSALDEQAYTALLQGAKAAACFTDPPYNVKIDGHVSGLGRVTHREFAMASGEMSEIEFTKFLTGFPFLHLQPHPSWRPYLCLHGLAAYDGDARPQLGATPCELLNLCVWAKSNGAWAHFIGRGTNSSSSSRTARNPTKTTFSLDASAATGPMFGIILVLAALLARGSRQHRAPPDCKARSQWSRMRSSIRPAETRSCSIRFSVAALPYSPPNARAGVAAHRNRSTLRRHHYRALAVDDGSEGPDAAWRNLRHRQIAATDGEP